MTSWFDIDKEGLAAILARRGKEFAVFELISNSWDAPGTTRVEVKIEAIPGKPEVRIEIIDDAPDGFTNLAHAYTLFARSEKAGDAEKRGRFNLGEKLVLALCRRAEIRTTTGCVVFEGKERSNAKRRTKSGSLFEGFLKMTREEMTEVLEAVRRLIPPEGIITHVNGIQLAQPKRIAAGTVTLPTEIADPEGNLRRSVRQTEIHVYSNILNGGSGGWIYELGIPVVATGDAFHVDVRQKVPLNMDRDNVTPAYLAQLRALVLNLTHDKLSEEQLAESWVTDAATRDEVAPEAVEAMMTARFGDKRVAYDPSDPEANKRAVAAGYTVVPGGALPAPTWDKVRAGNMAPAAGRVTPGHSIPYGDGPPLKLIPMEKWSDAMTDVANWTARMALHLADIHAMRVQMTADPRLHYGAMYEAGVITFNVLRLGRSWFEGPAEDICALILHELAHKYVSDHLSDEFADTIAKLGAKFARACAEDPLFWLRRVPRKVVAP